jgi:hypothetical protein
MGVGPADTTAMHAQKHFPGTRLRPLDLLKAKIIGAMKHRSLHRAHHTKYPIVTPPAGSVDRGTNASQRLLGSIIQRPKAL